MEFEVSRPKPDAGNPVIGPLDGETATRLYTPRLKIGQRGVNEPPVPRHRSRRSAGGRTSATASASVPLPAHTLRRVAAYCAGRSHAPSNL